MQAVCLRGELPAADIAAFPKASSIPSRRAGVIFLARKSAGTHKMRSFFHEARSNRNKDLKIAGVCYIRPT
jgi:hypothetical protein